MNLVVGSTGILGMEVCRQLRETNKPVRALVRKSSAQEKVQNLMDAGSEIAVGDLKDKTSLMQACQGVKTVISTASSTLSRQEGDSIQTVDLEGQLNLVEAASVKGVEHFIFITFPKDPSVSFPLADAKRQVEDALQKSEMTYTIFDANYFMEVWLSSHLGFDVENGKANIYGDGHQKLSWISFQDVAKFAVAAVDNPKAKNLRLAIGGPEALSPLDVIKIFEKLSGTKFDVNLIPIKDLEAQRDSTNDPLQKSFAWLMIFYANGTEMDMTEVLNIFPIKLKSVEDYAKSVLNAAKV